MARQKYERQQAKRAAGAHQRKIRQRITAALVVVIVLGGSIAWVVVSRANSAATAAASALDAGNIAKALASAAASFSPTPTPTETALPSPSSSSSSAPSSSPTTSATTAAAGSVDCTAPIASRADTLSFPSAPAPSPLSEKPALITLRTNCGDIVIETLPTDAPSTVASEVYLTESGFYNATACHRLTTAGIFVLQCGDPKGDGTGGPGYQVKDENLPTAGAANYPAGTVAMANAGPNTYGSQMFIVYADTSLPPGYTIWGKVTAGLDIVQSVAAAGVTGGSNDGSPAQSVTIQTATVQAR